MSRSLLVGAAALAVSVVPAAASFEYAYDDGVANIVLGPPLSFAQFARTDMIWGNYFPVTDGNNIITQISLMTGRFAQGSRDIRITIYDVPDATFNPFALTAPVYSQTVNVGESGQSTFFDFPITPTQVSAGFFVAAVLEEVIIGTTTTTSDRPARLDPDGAPFAANSWLIYSPEYSETNLGGNIGFATAMNNPQQVPIFGVWGMRATAVPSPGSGALLLTAIGLAAMRRRNYTRRSAGGSDSV